MILDQLFKSKNTPEDKSFKSAKSSDQPMRSIVKSISWRLIGTMDTITISWVITGKVGVALTIGSIELGTKMILYFLHERIWNIIKWGKK